MFLFWVSLSACLLLFCYCVAMFSSRLVTQGISYQHFHSFSPPHMDVKVYHPSLTMNSKYNDPKNGLIVQGPNSPIVHSNCALCLSGTFLFCPAWLSSKGAFLWGIAKCVLIVILLLCCKGQFLTRYVIYLIPAFS